MTYGTYMADPEGVVCSMSMKHEWKISSMIQLSCLLIYCLSLHLVS